MVLELDDLANALDDAIRSVDRKEKELRQLNASLETRVAERSHADMFSVGVELKSSSGTRGEWFELNEQGTVLHGDEGHTLRIGDALQVRVRGIDAPRGRVDVVFDDDVNALHYHLR